MGPRLWLWDVHNLTGIGTPYRPQLVEKLALHRKRGGLNRRNKRKGRDQSEQSQRRGAGRAPPRNTREGGGGKGRTRVRNHPGENRFCRLGPASGLPPT